MEKESINLKDSKEGIQQDLKGRKGRGIWCYYIIISKKLNLDQQEAQQVKAVVL